MARTHRLEPVGDALHGTFDPDRPPALTIEPGDTVSFRTYDCWWAAGPFGGGTIEDWPRVEGYWPDAGHALTGPVAIRGARAGQTLSLRLDAVVPATWGTTVAGGWHTSFNQRYGVVEEGVVHTWTLDPDAGMGRNQHGDTVPLGPFLGVLGMPPPEPGQHSTIPPRSHGGNLDCRELVAGSTLYLPIPVDEALVSVGDGHAAQGDGEVGGTAIECRMERVEITFDVHDDLLISMPFAETPAGLLTIGLGPTVDDATFSALDGMFELLVRRHGLSRPDAIALASVGIDVRITQIVNETVGVHALLRPDALRIASRG